MAVEMNVREMNKGRSCRYVRGIGSHSNHQATYDNSLVKRLFQRDFEHLLCKRGRPPLDKCSFRSSCSVGGRLGSRLLYHLAVRTAHASLK